MNLILSLSSLSVGGFDFLQKAEGSGQPWTLVLEPAAKVEGEDVGMSVRVMY